MLVICYLFCVCVCRLKAQQSLCCIVVLTMPTLSKAYLFYLFIYLLPRPLMVTYLEISDKIWLVLVYFLGIGYQYIIVIFPWPWSLKVNYLDIPDHYMTGTVYYSLDIGSHYRMVRDIPLTLTVFHPHMSYHMYPILSIPSTLHQLSSKIKILF